MSADRISLKDAAIEIVDNRGKTCPTASAGIPLIATNCIDNNILYPRFDRVRYVSDETFNNWFRGHPRPGDLIFVTKGAPGRVCLAPDPVNFCIAQDMVALRPNPDRIDPLYLFAALRSDTVQASILNMHVGTMIPHFKKGDFDKLYIPLPRKSLQKFIGELYFTLSAKIDINLRMNETLEAMARAIFKDWFVDFGPTHAKLACRAPYLASDIWSLFPDCLDDDGKPEGWNGLPLIRVCELKRGYDLPSQSRKPGAVPIISSSGPTGWHSEAMVKGPGIVTGRYGTIGQVFTCRSDFWPLNTTLYVRDFKGCPYWFVYHTLLGLDFNKYSDKGAVPGVNRNALHLEPVTLSPPELLRRFDETVTPLMSKASANTDQIETLIALRDLLLTKLLTGEISMNDAEKMVGEAA